MGPQDVAELGNGSGNGNGNGRAKANGSKTTAANGGRKTTARSRATKPTTAQRTTKRTEGRGRAPGTTCRPLPDGAGAAGARPVRRGRRRQRHA